MNEKDKKENKILFIGIGVIFLILLLTLGRYAYDKKNMPLSKEQIEEPTFSDFKYFTPDELHAKIISQEVLKLIDIRDNVSFEKNHIEESVNISPENFDKTFSTISKEQSVIIIGYDSGDNKNVATIIKKLKTELGFKNVDALSGGIANWTQSADPTISGGDKESALDWSKIDYITPDQLKLAIESSYPVTIVDVRTNKEYLSGHVPQAINIPLNELEKRKTELTISKEILVYGTTATDDFKAAVKLSDLGFIATYTLKGGFASWQEKRFDLVR
ncbi:MAG: rhodanese-like domain-containing protein [Parcubacteria group bacterium]|jgi:rhodanese-related sulfurtransferase